MKPFSKSEAIGVFLIFLLVFGFTLKGLLGAQRRARDAQRKADVGAISDALHRFFDDFGYFPPTEGGMIKMCKSERFDSILSKLKSMPEFDRNLYFEGLRGCIWGRDSFDDLLDASYPPYLKNIPLDPRYTSGFSYLYLSNTKRFQLYTYLEGGEKEEGYDVGIADRNLKCGMGICSWGKSFATTPLDISIEEYEKVLEEKRSGS